MDLQGILTIDVFGLVLFAVIVHLVRIQKLHVGYGILWLATTTAVMLIVSIPPLLHGITRAVGALFPASALSLLAFWFIFAILIFFSVKLTEISSRQTRLLQALALKELDARETAADGLAVPGADVDSGQT
jgi:hypothetical protein